MREAQRQRNAPRLDFEVRRGALAQARLLESEPPTPGPGEVLFEVERFALTANNLTYALLGDRFGYWNVFPASQGWGRLPVWGYLRVIKSRVEAIDQGRRAFGFSPMSTHMLMRPERTTDDGFTDGAPHRARAAPVYNAYSWLDRDAAYRPELEDQLLVLRPLFWLSFMLDDHLAEEELLDGHTVLITSASSKAAIGAAHLLTARGAELVALTSSSKLEFAAGLGLYDQVVSYDRIVEQPAVPAVLLDIAGSREVRADIERQFGDLLDRTVVAGWTHLDAAGADPESPEKRTSFLSAPERIRQRVAQIGWAELNRRYCAALHEFAIHAKGWLQIESVSGREDVARAYHQTLQNATPPGHALVLTLAA